MSKQPQTDEKRDVSSVRKAYQSPLLTEFGSIVELTKDNTLSITPEGPGQGNNAKKAQ